MLRRVRMLLEIKNLTVDIKIKEKYYPVLNNLNFSIKEGEVLGLVGESGSGKSVTAYTIMGLLNDRFKVVSGSIIFEGKDLLKMSLERRRKMLGKEMSIIFQNPLNALNPLLTIYDQMAEMLTIHNPKISKKEIKKRVIEALEEVQLENPEKVIKKYPHEFSGGQRQRILIAMAILNHPKLLIADEATTALDVTVQYRILRLLKSLCYKYKTTLIVISHNLGLIKYMSQQVIVMYTGQIMESARVKEIIGNPAHPYTRELLASLPENAVKGENIHAIEGRVPSILEKKENCHFYPRCKYRQQKCLEEKIVNREINKEHYAYCIGIGEADEGFTTEH